MDKDAINELSKLGLVIKEENLIQKKNITVATHDWAFHPDDMLCVGLLEKIYGKDHVTVIRSRDQRELDKADYVLDVGEKDEVSRDLEGRVNRICIDHHQEPGAESFYENGIKKSAIGKFVDYIFEDTPEREAIHRNSLDLLEYADNRQAPYDIRDISTKEMIIKRDNPYNIVLSGNIDDKDTVETKEHKVDISSRLSLAIFIKDAAEAKGEHGIAEREGLVIKEISAEKEKTEIGIIKQALDEVVRYYSASDVPGLCNTKDSNLINEYAAFSTVTNMINEMIEKEDETLDTLFGHEVFKKLLENGPINMMIGEDPGRTKFAIRAIQDTLNYKDNVNFYPCVMSPDIREAELKLGPGVYAHHMGNLITYAYSDKISRAQAWARGMDIATEVMKKAGLDKESHGMPTKNPRSFEEEIEYVKEVSLMPSVAAKNYFVDKGPGIPTKCIGIDR